MSEPVYLLRKVYNPDYGDDRRCVCGHPYHRHFDGYEGDTARACKYCGCSAFVEADETDAAKIARLERENKALREALDHPCLRELFGLIEDTDTRFSWELWAYCCHWFEARDEILANAEGSVAE